LDKSHLYIHWEGIGDNSLACFCVICQEKFYQKYHRLLTKTNFFLKGTISEKNLGLYHIDEEVQQLRYDTMTEFISKLAKYVKSKNKNVRNIVCFFIHKMDGHAATNWNDITSIDKVDIIPTSVI